VPPTRKDTALTPRPVVYAGRFADGTRSARLPGDCEVLDDWEVLPFRLAEALERATALVVLDPFSFPFESVRGQGRDVPLIVVPPPGFDAPFLRTVFGEALLESLGPLDRVATANPALWEELRQGYRWTEGQRIELDTARPDEAAAQVLARLQEEAAGPVQDKAVYRVRSGALGPQFAAACGVRAGNAPFDVLEVGVGPGRWASSFDPATGFAGLGLSEEALGAARVDFPGGRFDLLGEDLVFPYAEEGFDLAFTVSVLQDHPATAKKSIVSEMWRVVRPGGRLMFLEDFVSGEAEHVVSIQGFVGIVLEATAGRVVLEHFEALRYPADPFFRGGLLALSKVGTPQTW
jgi:SAM-dependent methyltransferase